MICFVILHYQAIDETINCINAIKKLRKEEAIKIILVDNASPNHSGKLLKQKYESDPIIEVLQEKENLGFAKGNNVGFIAAKKYDPDYIVVMNNDVLIEQKDFIQSIRRSDEKYLFDVLGPDIFSAKTGIHQNPQRDNNYTLEELESYIQKLHLKNKYRFLIKIKYFINRKQKINVSQKTDYTRVQFGLPLHGACYIFSGSFARSHDNCFYPKTFMYFESYILHYLGMRENLKFVYDPSIQVVHHEDVATDQTYKKQYQKSIFSNKCLEDSAKCFREVMLNDKIRLNNEYYF
ncbi:MAG: glycosyltransferase [Clostridiales bacterium]|nr:glycosyltransferase [Clostridiales bacterium]